jgi:hypothetical protein
MTILHRIWLKKNIMEAFRLHFFQILANEKKTTRIYNILVGKIYGFSR